MSSSMEKLLWPTIRKLKTGGGEDDTTGCLLTRYDTIKTCRWNFFKFSLAVDYKKICKNKV